MSEEFQNYTFICSVESPLQHILKALVENNFTISQSLIIKANSVVLIPIPQYNISFISLSHFLDGSFFDHRIQFGITEELKYFPQALSDMKFWDLTSDTITLHPDMYFDLCDSKAIIEDKKRYYDTIAAQKWSFKAAMKDVCLSELSIHVASSIALLKTSFSFQVECLEVFGQSDLLEPKHFPFFHLFNYVSLGSYVHSTFRLYLVSRTNVPFCGQGGFM
jgi:hypothetical protein